jgi:hypothetical protein
MNERNKETEWEEELKEKTKIRRSEESNYDGNKENDEERRNIRTKKRRV